MDPKSLAPDASFQVADEAIKAENNQCIGSITQAGDRDNILNWNRVEYTRDFAPKNKTRLNFLSDAKLLSSPGRIWVNENATMQEDGVFNVVGLEVWEAALLLCAYLHKSPIQGRVLELGSGVGLPGFYLSTCKDDEDLDEDRQGNRAQGVSQVIATDYESQILSNLCRSASYASLQIPLRVCKFDWTFPTFSPHLECDVVIGAALVYAPEMGRTMANVIYDLLFSGAREVLIIQLRDRAGFLHLLRGLDCYKQDGDKNREGEIRDHRRLCYTANQLDQETYDLACQIDVVDKYTDSGGYHWRCYDFGFLSSGHDKRTSNSKCSANGSGLIRTPVEAFDMLHVWLE